MNKKRKTLVIGLTGSIGMGKSTASKMFAALGLPVLSADTIVHDLFAAGGEGTKKIARLYPEAVGAKGVNRAKLSKLVFDDKERLCWLEDLIHPLVFKACSKFIREQKRAKAPAVILEIPLLFETGYDASCDFTVCVSATAALQKKRVLKRKGMTPAKLRAVLTRQMPDKEKKKRADFVITSSKGRADTRAQIKLLCKRLFTERNAE